MFKLLMDDANAKTYQSLAEWLPLAGVTTNPSILAKNSHVSAEKQLQQLDDVLTQSQSLHIQLISERTDDMVAEAERIKQAFARDVIIKIPVSTAGMSAITRVAEQGVKVTATGIFTVQQAFWAAKAGASFVAPYVNRIDQQHGNSVDVLKRVRQLFDADGLPTRILAASFKNLRQLEEAMLAGVHEATVSADLLEKLLDHHGTDEAIHQFKSDFSRAFGADKTMYSN